MATAPKTLQAIDEAGLAAREKENRKHLGASVIGRKCAREVFYKWRWAKTENLHSARLLRLFGRGHKEEPKMIELLKAAGMEVWQAGEDGENKAAFRVTDCDGHFGGTPDGVGRNCPDLPAEMLVLLEFKTFNDSQFGKLKEQGVITAKWEYFIQMQIYMEKHDLPCALFMAVNKNDDEIYLEIVQRDTDKAQQYLERARTIIYATEPPARIADTPGHKSCKFCDFVSICHFNDAPEINCRTCAHASVGPAGSWLCARDRAEIGEQAGCPEHLYAPAFFEGWEVLDGDFAENWYDIGVPRQGQQPEVYRFGPNFFSSSKFLQDGIPPF